MRYLRLSLAAALCVISCEQSHAQSSDRTITVLSTGVATASAQQVTLQLSVVTQDQTATAIFVKQNDIVQRLKKTLSNAGASDVQELPFRLMPNYEYGQQGTRIIGYRLETPIELTLTNLSELPHLIDLATQSGASSVTVGAFGLAKGASLHDEALRDAMQGARREAETLAKEMGKSVGDVLSVTETEDADKAPAPRGGEEEEERREKAKVNEAQPSTLSEKAELRVTYQLK